MEITPRTGTGIPLREAITTFSKRNSISSPLEILLRFSRAHDAVAARGPWPRPAENWWGSPPVCPMSSSTCFAWENKLFCQGNQVVFQVKTSGIRRWKLSLSQQGCPSLFPLNRYHPSAKVPRCLPPREVQGQGIAGRSRGMLGHLAKYPWVLDEVSLGTWGFILGYLGK